MAPVSLKPSRSVGAAMSDPKADIDVGVMRSPEELAVVET
jgi:hypothetical protein